MSKLRITSGLALLLFIFAVASVSAQVPYIQAYFCPTKETEVCQGAGALSELCIYTHNFLATYDAVEFGVSYPSAVTWVADHPIDTYVVVGDTPNGITLGWIAPFLPPHVPSLLMTVTVRWNCDQCPPVANPITIIPHPVAGHIAYYDVDNQVLRHAVGMTTMICSALPTEETTWGKVKSLFVE